MANLKEVRTRIASVSSTQQITSAMKMVSAAKFRRAQNAIVGMRPYAAQLADIMSSIGVADGVSTPYHEVRPARRVLLVVVTSNKGLCGAFNSNVLKLADQRIAHYRQQLPADGELRLMTIGRKATEALGKREGLPLEAHDDLLDNTTFDAAASLLDTIMDDFAAKRLDRVEVVYNLFKNSLSQVPSAEQLLPVTTEDSGDSRSSRESGNSSPSAPADFIFEPSKEEILREMVPLTLRATFYRVLLDSLAAEHGARMTSMQKATDNAQTLLADLRLTYNKARQAAITNEIIEIVSGSEALKG